VQPTFWIQRWQDGQIGFHEGKPNKFLVSHAARLTGVRVLVPLCGKAEDLAYLASRGHTVIGIELVEDAVRAFFAEHGLEPTVEKRGAITAYTANAVTILAGDLFTVTRADVGAIDAIYDRAALIALPPDLRRRYVDHLRVLAPAGTPSLLVTLEYPQDRFEGPPFAVLEDEVRRLFAAVEPIDEAQNTAGRIAQAGLPSRERCYITKL
jgi:thiopurine S-methyltransferase